MQAAAHGVRPQAEDRSHRLGQERPVTVFRLITAGTVTAPAPAPIPGPRTLPRVFPHVLPPTGRRSVTSASWRRRGCPADVQRGRDGGGSGVALPAISAAAAAASCACHVHVLMHEAVCSLAAHTV